MSLATQTLNKQKKIYFTYIWRGLALLVIGVYAGLMILKNGMGTSVQTGGGANVWLRKLLNWLTDQGIDAWRFLPYCMIGLFVVIAAIGLFNLVRGLWLMASPHTMLGKSIQTQRRSSESFRDVVDDINADMEQDPYSLGSVMIGRRWILDIEAMRLADIRGVFWFDQAKGDYVLCCVDANQNIWAASLPNSAERDKAADYLQKMLPHVASGDKNAYIRFLGGGPEDEETPDSDTAPPTLSPEATFCFVNVDGIPTSNFTPETVLTALHMLELSQTIALRVLTPRDSAVTEIFCTRGGSRWTVGVLYGQDDEQHSMVKKADVEQAATMMEGVLQQKRLPDLATPQ